MTSPTPAPAGSIEELREEAIQDLHLVAFHASMAVDQFSVSADAGGLYNARRARAHMVRAIEVLKMLVERDAREQRALKARRADLEPRRAQGREERA